MPVLVVVVIPADEEKVIAPVCEFADNTPALATVGLPDTPSPLVTVIPEPAAIERSVVVVELVRTPIPVPPSGMPLAIANAVVAIVVSFVPAVWVGAVGLPVRAGETDSTLLPEPVDVVTPVPPDRTGRGEESPVIVPPVIATLLAFWVDIVPSVAEKF